MRYQFKPNGEKYSEGDRQPRYVHWSKRWEKLRESVKLPIGPDGVEKELPAGTVIWGDSHTFSDGRNADKRKYGRGPARKRLRREVNRLERLADLADNMVDASLREFEGVAA